jgi:hypothetical protein
MGIQGSKLRNFIDVGLVVGGVIFTLMAVYGGWSDAELRHNMAIAAVLLMFAANVPYVIDALAGRTAPHFITWLLLGVITVLAFMRQLQDGAQLATVYPLLAAGIMNFLNCLVGLRQATFKIKVSDWACGLAGVGAIYLWHSSNDPVLTVVFLTVASLLAFAPTVRKAWLHPESETFRTYPRNTLRYGLIAAAVNPFNLVTVLYPATWVAVNGLFTVYLLARKAATR